MGIAAFEQEESTAQNVLSLQSNLQESFRNNAASSGSSSQGPSTSDNNASAAAPPTSQRSSDSHSQRSSDTDPSSRPADFNTASANISK